MVYDSSAAPIQRRLWRDDVSAGSPLLQLVYLQATSGASTCLAFIPNIPFCESSGGLPIAA